MSKLSYKIIGISFLVLCISFYQLRAETATKNVSASFNINSDTRIEISNKFGNVIIKKWNKNVVDLQVNIVASSNSISKTQEILDAIEIEISDKISSGRLSIETIINTNNGNNSSFSVLYEVSMPNTNTLKLSNSFGNIYMGSYKGPLELELKYGQLMAEDLDEASVRIDFSNAKCEIESLRSGELDLRYSKMMIEEMGDIEISSQFSDLDIEDAKNIKLNGKHCKIKIEALESLKGDIQFSGLDIEYLEKSIFLKTLHGNGINLDEVSKSFESIEIDGEFSTINITVESGATSMLYFDLQFGNLKAQGDGINFDRVVKNLVRSEYEGYLVKKETESIIKVKTKYGNIRFEVK